MPNGALRKIEQSFGLPPLTQVSEVIRSLPDEKKLRLVKQVLDSATKVKGSPEELRMVLDLIRLITATNMEQLTAVRDILANLAKLVKLLPKDLKQLPLKEIIEEVKK